MMQINENELYCVICTVVRSVRFVESCQHAPAPLGSRHFSDVQARQQKRLRMWQWIWRFFLEMMQISEENELCDLYSHLICPTGEILSTDQHRSNHAIFSGAQV